MRLSSFVFRRLVRRNGVRKSFGRLRRIAKSSRRFEPEARARGQDYRDLGKVFGPVFERGVRAALNGRLPWGRRRRFFLPQAHRAIEEHLLGVASELEAQVERRKIVAQKATGIIGLMRAR
jgi:hypothetical protein